MSSNSGILAVVSFYNQTKYRQFLDSDIPDPGSREDTGVDGDACPQGPPEGGSHGRGRPDGIKCYYCGHMMKDEGVKIKLDGKYHYLCCSVCAKLYKEKSRS